MQCTVAYLMPTFLLKELLSGHATTYTWLRTNSKQKLDTRKPMLQHVPAFSFHPLDFSRIGRPECRVNLPNAADSRMCNDVQ